MSMSHDEYIDLSVDNIDDTKDIEFDTYNDEIRINPVLKTHLDDGDKLVWYKDPTIIATWHSNGRLDVPCFDATDVTISAVNFRILKGHWRTKDEHGVGTESNHWLYDDKPISEYLDLYPDFWKANEIKAVQPKKERKPRQKEETSDKSTNIILPRQNDIVREYKYESEKHLYDSNYSDTYSNKLRKQATPSWVAEDMIDLLPDEVWRTDSKFLDIYCKSGIFLEIIIDRLMKKVDYTSIGLTSDREIRQHIIKSQVYAICWNKCYLDLSRKSINGKSSMVGNIYCIGSEIENMTEEEAKKVLENDKEQSSIDKTLLGIDIRKEFFKDMQFDVVVGNPPYNNDIYIPFVEMGHQIANNCSVFITPAKWQAKGGQKNESFRDNIVPHIKAIVYYSDACNIFNVALGGGVSYYIIDKKIHIDKIVNGNYINDFDVNMPLDITEEERAIVNKIKSINSNIILNKFEPKLSWNTILSFSGDHYRDDMEHVGSGYWLVDKNKRIEIDTKYVKEASKAEMWQTVHGPYSNKQCTANIYKPHEIAPSYAITLYAGNKDDVLSADSYYKCKLIWWLVARFFGSSGLNTKSFRLVPEPDAFDHIFNDDELYKKYNLTMHEISIIESFIKDK